jgi:two-component system, LuxR family, sensor kinase FixL
MDSTRFRPIDGTDARPTGPAPGSTDRTATHAQRARRAFTPPPSVAFLSSYASVVVVTIVALSLLALSSWLARADLEQARAIASLGDQARSVQIGADRLLSTLTDAETGQRGYLLTGDAIYLQPYEAARARLPSNFAELRATSLMRGSGASLLSTIDGLANAKMAELARTIALAKGGDLPAAIAIVRSDRGKQIMDDMRGRLSALEASAGADLLRDQLRATSDWSAAVVVGLGMLSSLLLAGVALSQSRARRAVAVSLAALEKFTRAFDLSHGMLCGMDGTITFWAAGMERLYGYTAGEAIGRTSQALLDTRFPIPLSQIIEILLRDGQWQGELVHRHRDGSIIEAATHWALQRGSDGEATGIIKLNNDISEARRAQRERDATSELLAAIVASSDDAILSKTIEGVVTSWNTGAERLFGYTAAEAVGRHIAFLLAPERLGEEKTMMAAVLAGEMIEHYETVRVAKDGRRVDISASMSPIRDKAGRIIGAAKVARDIAALKRLEVERVQYLQALERSNKELDDFAYIASHDLKEPLRGLFNNAKFLHEDYADKIDAEGVKRLLRLGHLCQRMEQLVNDLLYFSRLGRQDLAIQSTDLNAVIRDIEVMSETFLQERQAVIVIPHALPQTLCDKTRITEVFRNLIINAVKYNESTSKRIEVGYLDAMETADGFERQVFYVKDNGIGIAKEFYEDIFRIFKRLNAEDDDKKGSGVGLTFVRKIIERHGGRIWIDSALGAGATFYFTIGRGQVYEAAA